MRSLAIGIVGHVDHGKSALVRALTGMETDRLAEEQRRGLSIALGFAHLRGEEGSRIDLIDMPGHERFVRTMVAGATGIGAVLVVVAANEGVRPQTREHVLIARLLGIGRAVLAVTKADLADRDQIAKAATQAADLLAGHGLRAGPPIVTSAAQGTGIEQLRAALVALAATVPMRRSDGSAFLPVDRAFTLPGHGAIVTGTLRGAAVRPGDALDLWPSRRKVRVRAVQVHGTPVAEALPGQRTALNLRDIAAGDLGRGMALAAQGSLAPSAWLTLAIEASPDAPLLRNGVQLSALFGTCDVEARLRLLDGDGLEPGTRGFAQIRCPQSVALPAGEHVVLRLPAPLGTVAGGRLIDPLAQHLRRHDASILARLKALRDLSPEQVLAQEAGREGAGASVAGLSRLCALDPARTAELLAGLPVVVSRRGIVLRAADLDRAVAAILTCLDDEPLGLSRKQLLAALPSVGAVLLNQAVAATLADGRAVQRGGQVLLPRFDVARAQDASDAETAAAVARLLHGAGLSPPNPAAIVGDAASRRAVQRLLRLGTIVRAVDRAKGREMLFHREAIRHARARLAPLLARDDGLLVSEISAALGITRKFTMPLLAHLDAIGFTRRIGDRRVPGRIAATGPFPTVSAVAQPQDAPGATPCAR